MSPRPKRLVRRPIHETLEVRRLFSGTTVSISVSPGEIPEVTGNYAIFTLTRSGDTSSSLSVAINDDTNSTLSTPGSTTKSGSCPRNWITPTIRPFNVTIPAGSATGQFKVAVRQYGSGTNGKDYAVLDVLAGPGYEPGSSPTATLVLDQTAIFHNCDGCQQTVKANSEIGLATGEYLQDHQLVTYSSQGQDRGIDLQYSSLQAAPKPIVQAVVSTTGGRPASAMTSVTASMTIDTGSPSSPITYTGVSLSAGQSFLVALQGDATSLSTGVHAVQLTITEYFTGYSPFTQTINSTVDVVNSASVSPTNTYP